MPRYVVDRVKRKHEDESSPAVLLSSGYIAGGSIAGVLIAFLSFPVFDRIVPWLNVGAYEYFSKPLSKSNWPGSLAAFGLLVVVLAMTGLLASTKPRAPQSRGGTK